MGKKIILIFFLGLFLRLGYVLFVPQIDVNSFDPGYYSTIARNLVVSHVYTYDNKEPDIFWAPGYPFFISVIYKIFGFNNTAVRVMQAFLSALVIPLIYFIGSSLFSPGAGIMAAVIASLYPPFIGYSGLFLPQVLSLFLITLFIFILIRMQVSIGRDLILGMIAGYASITRQELILFWSILLLLVIFASRERKRAFRHVCIVFIMMIFIVSLWSLRNYRIFGRFIPVSTHYGDTLWISTWKEEWLEWQQKEPFISIGKGKSHIDAQEAYFKAGLHNIKEYPFRYLVMCFKRLYRLWLTGHSNIFYFMTDSIKNYFIKGNYSIVFIKIAMLFLNISIIILGFLGMQIVYAKKLMKKTPCIQYIIFPILFFIILHFFTFATPRYAVPIMPFVILFTAFAIRQLKKRHV